MEQYKNKEGIVFYCAVVCSFGGVHLSEMMYPCIANYILSYCMLTFLFSLFLVNPSVT